MLVLILYSSVALSSGVYQLLSCEFKIQCFYNLSIFFSDNSLARSTLGFKVGQLLIFAYFTIFYTQIFKAMNRFLAIFSPVKYRKLFGNENIKFIIIIAIAFGLIHSLLYFIPGCNFYYDGDYVAWDYDYTPCYDIMAVYVDLIVCCSIMAIVMLIDSYTLCLIIKTGLFKRKNSSEVKLFTQTFSTSILYTIMVISNQIICYLNTGSWYVFITSTIVWELCHTIDG